MKCVVGGGEDEIGGQKFAFSPFDLFSQQFISLLVVVFGVVL